ncbi:SDR family oxidoreductase [Candidatus Uabimicrobium amorphum]|uniref:Enoyl-[acyl-carrier-protein] reductase [NADPH]FabL n=1 Tax=Uabimicrobium amorphum TaxID=2596890 RepID=A0A5S9ITK3_UABAM|nr:SDR family oxidoreductase [Candidatus Uabimicrobium amorphum]BBM87376.1 enoyl-[acyl-carrier-protein] reductase [NADPH]FabL [Candidatus Uabimicrobium amorphum]
MLINLHDSSANDLKEILLQVFSEVTRYPRDILTLDADFEEELGIDSVKLSEVFAVLQQRYPSLEEHRVSQQKFKNLREVINAMTLTFTENNDKSVAVESTVTHSPPAAKIEKEVREVFSAVTRYPLDILTLDADFEEELGIDSVKLSEVFSILQQQFPALSELDISKKKFTNLRQIISEMQILQHIPTDKALPTITATPPRKTLPFTENSSSTFKGQIAFISGSGRGIGKEIALHLLKNGATVIINSFHSRTAGEDLVKELKQQGRKVHHVWGSFANPQHITRMFAEVEAVFGGVDIFIHNASNGILARVDQITTKEWQKAYRTNVIGFHQGAMHAAKMMRQNGGGKIMTLSSPGTQGYIEYFSCIATVKAAVESLVKSMAAEWKPWNISVNCLSVGAVYGHLLHKFPESEQLIPFWESLTTSGKLCTAQDVAKMVAWILCRKSLSGSIVNMDGGSSVYTYVNRMVKDEK